MYVGVGVFGYVRSTLRRERKTVHMNETIIIFRGTQGPATQRFYVYLYICFLCVFF